MINCKGKLIDLKVPKVMGILNLTPDSFYDGGTYIEEKAVLDRVAQMLEQGVDFIDLGAYSSRPGAPYVEIGEERSRLFPFLEKIVDEFPQAVLSIDTFRSEIAREAIDKGAAMINDISAGGLDPDMFKVIAGLQVPYIIMHMRGNPQTMARYADYENLLKEVIYYFSEKIFELRQLGVNDIIIDPGYGFSKTMDQNFELLAKSELLNALGVPILTGVSRKSMLYKLLGTSAQEAGNATTCAHTIALLKGTSILRVHDVVEAREAITIVEQIKKHLH